MTLCQSAEGGHCFLDGLLEERYASTLISLLIAILVDMQEFYYPTGVAYPIGGGGPRYIVMETHYDNPQMRSGTFYFVNNYIIIVYLLLLLQRLSFQIDIVDSSGMVFSYTATAPIFEAGILQIGHSVHSSHVIPPGAEQFNSFADCNKECTSRVGMPNSLLTCTSY